MDETVEKTRKSGSTKDRQARDDFEYWDELGKVCMQSKQDKDG